MNFMNDTNFYPAVVNFSTVKDCFILIPEKLKRNIPADLPVFKITFGEQKENEAYMSCGKEAAHKSDLESKIFMNEKYAEKLGIKEKEWVLVQPMFTSIPKADKVILEPLTSDDWEIMELNASFIERDLMNQIRVVWANQIFPIWIKNTFFYSKVVTCEPDHCPVVLSENSIVCVVPKDRYPNQEYTDVSSPMNNIKKANYLQFQHLRNKPIPKQLIEDNTDVKKNHSFSNDKSPEQLTEDIETDVRLFHSIFDLGSGNISTYNPFFFASWFSSPKTGKRSIIEYSEEEFEEFYDYNFDSLLRVLPYSGSKTTLPSIMGSTTVFISADTYVACCNNKLIPPCFVGLLQKFPQPEKKLKKTVAADSGSKNNKDNYLSDSSLSKNSTKMKRESDPIDGQRPFDSVCVTVMVMKSAEEDEFGLPLCLYTYKNAIVVPKELKKSFNLEVTSLVNLKSVSSRPVPLTRLIMHPVTTLDLRITEKDIKVQFIEWAFSKNSKDHTFVISDGTFLKLKILEKKCEFFVRLPDKDTNSPKEENYSGSFNSSDSDKSVNMKTDAEYGLLTYKCAKNISLKVGCNMCVTIYNDRPYLMKDAGLYCDIKSLKLEELGGIEELSAKAIKNIEFWLKLRPLAFISNHSFTYSGCMLISGPKGVGKSALAYALCKKFATHPYYVFIQTVQCLSLKGKRVETIAKKWDNCLSEATYSQPSIILLEDLDYIASSPISQEQENGPDGAYFASISQAFVHMMNRIMTSESKVAVIVTAQSLHSLHPSLVNTKGRHIFQSILEINPPTAEQRAEILLSMVSSKAHISDNTRKHVNFSEIAAKTEGYVAQDLCTLVDRAVHAAWVKLVNHDDCSQVILKTKYFEAALKGMTPSSLRGISLQMQDHRTWKDVGGLKNVKKIIQQIILWPTKYKHIYKNYSLKPQTNILLYGAPGTGKTLLAGVVANQCGLNFISIKGPELLSKYIGASEQAIRDLFKRATTARPCILFFDEFDSIAPRRGHDSTGVTDRVVNQLLTQLDGVESLEGVHVLAATSRPELIDPALLRPGRLDKCLHCPLPEKEERVDILHALSSKLPLSDDIDFNDIAALTENFSGADLQALLYSAHIEALHDVQRSKRHYSTSAEDIAYSLACDKLLYMPTIEDGLKTPSYEEGKKIIQDVKVIQDKYFGIMEQSSRRQSTLSVSITQRHLLKVASDMKPSVSYEERLRYEFVFKNFQSSLSGESQTVVVNNAKRVTLA